MEVPDGRRIGERREADQRSGEERRIDKKRRIWSRRFRARETTDEGRYDRRGGLTSLFAVIGFPLLRGVRRMGSARRSGAVRRSFIRRWVDRAVS